MPSILEHEAAIDDLIQTLFKKLRAEHGHGEICDLSAWIDLLPPDVVSALLWSKPLGLIKKGCDFEKMVYGIERGASLSLIPLILSWTPNALAWMGFSAIAPLLF